MVHKNIDEAKANMETAIATIPERYRLGVKKANWKGPAGSEQAETNYKTGISVAITKKLRQKGIAKVSNEEWQNKAATKGGDVIGTRMTEALEDYVANFGPILSKVNSFVDTLPARTTDYISNIDKRLKPTVKVMKQAAGKL